MRKILLPWGGEMGIISLRCRVSAASGGASPAAGGGVLVTPCRCRAILFSSSLYHLLIGRATRIGPSRAAGKNFNLRGTGRNVQPGHSCFSVQSGRQQMMVYRTGSYSSCIQNPCPLFRRICGRAGDTPPFPVRCAFSRWNSVHADLGFPPRGRNLPAAAGFYGVRVLGLTPRRAGGRCLPRPRWSARSGRGGPSCPSGGSAPSAAPSPCRGGAGR